MILIIYFCTTILLLVLVLHASLHYSKFGRIINKIPGLPPVPIFGNLLQLMFPTDEIWSKINHLFEKYYPIFVVWSLRNATVFIRHPDDLKILLSCKKNISKSDGGYSSLRYAAGDGIITSTGQRWQHRRKILNHAFTANNLEIYTEKINKRANKFIAELQSRGDIFSENITPMFLKFALSTICDTLMDVDIDKLSAVKEKEFRDAIDELLEIVIYRLFRPYICNFMMPFLPMGWRLTRVSKILQSFQTEIIQTRRKYHESMKYNIFENGANTTEDEITDHSVKGMKKNLAVVDLLLTAEEKGLIDFYGTAEEIINIATAGYETTGMALSFLLTLLAENKEEQNLARAEIVEILDDDKCISLKHVKNMVYLDRCVKESLRIFPTAPQIGREITHDIRLSKHTLPAGVTAFISLYDLHRDHRFWPEPEKFDPDRFLPENVKQRHPFAYLPFSTGPRNCIGQKLALAEIKLVTAHILYNFYLELTDGIVDLKSKMNFTIRVNRINMKFVRINRD